MHRLASLFCVLLSFPAGARSRNLWHGRGFRLLDSQLTRFLEEAYEGRVSDVKVLNISRLARRENVRRVRFQFERDGNMFHVACELSATEQPDVIRTRACQATPSARMSDYARPLSAFTTIQ